MILMMWATEIALASAEGTRRFDTEIQGLIHLEGLSVILMKWRWLPALHVIVVGGIGLHNLPRLGAVVAGVVVVEVVACEWVLRDF